MALLKVTRRDRLGTRHSRRLREKDFIPAIIYGHGQDNIAVSLTTHDIELAVRHGEQLLKCELDGKEENFLIKDVQHDYLGHRIIHVDLARVSLDERVEVTVPIVLRGTSVGVESEDGVLTQHLAEVNVECLVTAIPSELRVSIAEMHVNDVLRVADMDLPEGLKVIEEAETVVASVSVMAEEVEAAAEGVAEVAAEPEVIGEKEEKEEQEPSDKSQQSKQT